MKRENQTGGSRKGTKFMPSRQNNRLSRCRRGIYASSHKRSTSTPISRHPRSRSTVRGRKTSRRTRVRNRDDHHPILWTADSPRGRRRFRSWSDRFISRRTQSLSQPSRSDNRRRVRSTIALRRSGRLFRNPSTNRNRLRLPRLRKHAPLNLLRHDMNGQKDNSASRTLTLWNHPSFP